MELYYWWQKLAVAVLLLIPLGVIIGLEIKEQKNNPTFRTRKNAMNKSSPESENERPTGNPVTR